MSYIKSFVRKSALSLPQFWKELAIISAVYAIVALIFAVSTGNNDFAKMIPVTLIVVMLYLLLLFPNYTDRGLKLTLFIVGLTVFGLIFAALPIQDDIPGIVMEEVSKEEIAGYHFDILCIYFPIALFINAILLPIFKHTK